MAGLGTASSTAALVAKGGVKRVLQLEGLGKMCAVLLWARLGRPARRALCECRRCYVDYVADLHSTLYRSGAAGVVVRRCGLCRGWNLNLHLFVWAYHCSVCKPATSVSKMSLMGLALCTPCQLVLYFSFAALYKAPGLRCRRPGTGGPRLRCSLLHRALGKTWAASLFAAAVGSAVRAANACARQAGTARDAPSAAGSQTMAPGGLPM